MRKSLKLLEELAFDKKLHALILEHFTVNSLVKICAGFFRLS
jgi:hypothetical protein